MKKRGGCLGRALIILIILAAIGGVVGGRTRRDESAASSAAPQEEEQQQSDAANDGAQDSSNEGSLLDSFINSYNANSNSPITSTEPHGAMGVSAVSYGCEIVIIDQPTLLLVEIENTGEMSDLREPFRDVFVTLLSGMSDDEINALFDEAIAEIPASEEDVIRNFDGVMIDFSGPNEYESGHIQFNYYK